MHMNKRIICVLMVVLFVFSAAGCGTRSTEDDTKAVNAAIDKFAACKSFTIEQITESTEISSIDGVDYKYEGTNVLELSMITEPDIEIMNSKTIIVKADEGEVEQSTISYLLSENGVYTEYFTDGADWYKLSTDDVSLLSGINARAFASAFFVDVLSFGKAGDDELDSGKAFRYEGSLGGAELVTMLESIGYFNHSISSMSENQQLKIKENLAKDLKPVTVKVWVDEALGYPVRFEVSLTSMLKNLDDSISKSLGDKSSGDWAITEYVISMTVKDFDAVGDIVLPAEAASAKLYEPAA